MLYFLLFGSLFSSFCCGCTSFYNSRDSLCFSFSCNLFPGDAICAISPMKKAHLGTCSFRFCLSVVVAVVLPVVVVVAAVLLFCGPYLSVSSCCYFSSASLFFVISSSSLSSSSTVADLSCFLNCSYCRFGFVYFFAKFLLQFVFSSFYISFWFSSLFFWLFVFSWCPCLVHLSFGCVIFCCFGCCFVSNCSCFMFCSCLLLWVLYRSICLCWFLLLLAFWGSAILLHIVMCSPLRIHLLLAFGAAIKNLGCFFG